MKTYLFTRIMSLIQQSILKRSLQIRKVTFFKINEYLNANGTKRNLFSSSFKPNISHEETRSFLNTFPVIIKDLTDHDLFNIFPEMKNRLDRMMEYSSLAGNKSVPLTMLMAYKSFEKPEKLTDENMTLAYILGWLTELVQIVFFMTTDVAEEINTRKNIPTWHTYADVQLKAANDSTILENYVFLFLKKYFSSHSRYEQLMDLFNNTIYKTFQGIGFESCNVNIEDFSMDRLEKIAKYRFFYSCYLLPIYSAMYLADMTELRGFESTENVLFEMAKYTKVENDYLDSFNCPSFNTNIRFGRCSWLALKAYEKASLSQKDLLKKFYGCLNNESTHKIRCLYEELDIPRDFQNHRNESFRTIRKKIDDLSMYNEMTLLRQVLNNFVIAKAVRAQ
ncbi:uncharacterized protein [Leptinotarsa decemlineata]|uniref:uncharacterized protein n=1 Tax=Leptinotarsa decemlineata TaxID=7539 RepID=UPI003D30654A